MNEINTLHNRAMDLADQAVQAARQGDASREQTFLKQAFETEQEAAMLVVSRPELEPTRSVLFRSAAALALDAGLHRDAERMAALGLSGNPPESIANELRDLIEETNFARHLELHGIELHPNEIQVSIWEGNSVGHGIIRSDELISRVKRFEQLSMRTAARKRGAPFDERSALPKEIRKSFQTFVSIPRRGSFAFTMRIGFDPQLGLFEGDSNVDILGEVVHLLELFNDKRIDELHQLIPEEAYFRNFIAQAREIAPDGERVKQVGITAVRQGKLQKIRLEPKEALLSTPPKPSVHSVEEVGDLTMIRGELLVARAHRGYTISVVDDAGHEEKIVVPSGMLNDIVRPLWGEQVLATVKKVHKGFELVEIKLDID